MRPSSFPILALSIALAACTAEPASNDIAAENGANAQVPAARPPTLPTIAQPLSRRDLLLAVGEAASDHAAGVNDAERQRALDGRPFSLALRFCEGDGGSSVFQSAVNEESGVLQLQVRPDLDAAALANIGIDPEAFEAVEGFWIRRPWLLTPACPVAPSAPADPSEPEQESGPEVDEAAAPTPTLGPAPAGERIGIVQVFDDTRARSQRRGDRPYQVTRRLTEGQVPGAVDLVIEGRLRSLPGGKVISCGSRSAMVAPTCIISVRIDQVSLRQLTGEVLGEWGGS